MDVQKLNAYYFPKRAKFVEQDEIIIIIEDLPPFFLHFFKIIQHLFLPVACDIRTATLSSDLLLFNKRLVKLK
jgi:hypothetical protein